MFIANHHLFPSASRSKPPSQAAHKTFSALPQHATHHPCFQAYLSCEQMNDFKGMLDDAHGHEFLAIVAPMHHHGVGETLHNRALGFAKALSSITSGTMGQIFSIFLLHSNIILQKYKKQKVKGV